MNRYLIAALYVMAGCAVVVPLKTQGALDSLKGERCRLVITDTVKKISVYVENREEKQVPTHVPPDCFFLSSTDVYCDDFSFNKSVRIKKVALCWISHRIRAPEYQSCL